MLPVITCVAQYVSLPLTAPHISLLRLPIVCRPCDNTIDRGIFNNSYERIKMDSLVSNVSAQNESKGRKRRGEFVKERDKQTETKRWRRGFISLTLVKSVQEY